MDGLLPRGVCHTCGEKGHMKKDCGHSNAVSAKCGRRGHLAKICRRTQINNAAGDTWLTIDQGTKGTQIKVKTDESYSETCELVPGKDRTEDKASGKPIRRNGKIRGMMWL